MVKDLIKYYYTVRDLKWIQVFYQIKNRLFKSKYKHSSQHPPHHNLTLSLDEPSRSLLTAPCTFHFLNVSVNFSKKINWAYLQEGLLWNYNLNYFDYLHQKDIENQLKLSLIDNFVASDKGNHDPYPSSLRIINWIIYFSQNNLAKEKHIGTIYSDSLHLEKRIEYHLLGNHILENAFALLFASYFFKSKRLFRKASMLLEKELSEQINGDGGHFERSLMYHKIILHRVLQSIDLIRNNSTFNKEVDLLENLERRGELMLGYLLNMCFEDGTYPHFNDSCDHIAPSSSLILLNARQLKLNARIIPLGSSGFRRFIIGKVEGFINVGSLTPKYIPGHAHSDIAHIIVNFEKKPFLVDTGISTYENNEIRTHERSTAAHNTVSILNEDQSQVWSAFRVGRKARVVELKEGFKKISVSHDGYKRFGAIHKRVLDWNDASIFITDFVNKDIKSCAYLHFHPNVKVSKKAAVYKADDCYIEFDFAEKIEVEDYQYAHGFNNTESAKRLCIYFTKKLVTKLIIK